MKHLLSVLLCLWSMGLSIHAQTLLKAEDLAKDYAILKQTLEALHPGLYKYSSPEIMNQHFAELESALSQDQDLLSVYKAISLFTNKVQCGHTYGNFWNQGKTLRSYFINTPNKVPFTLRILDKEVYVHQNLSQNEALQPGDRIISMNGKPMPEVLEQLKAFVKADGANDRKRYDDLQVFGNNNFQAFDIYLPLVLALDTQLSLEVEAYPSGERKTLDLALITRQERFDRLTQRFGKQVESYDDYWNFKVLDNGVGYLQVGTFVTWKMNLNWRKFLNTAFQTLEDQKIGHLILDIRGNEGGDGAVQNYLYKKLRKNEAESGPFQQTLRTNYVEDALRPYLSTWSNNVYDQRSRTIPLADGFYTFKKGGLITGTKKANKDAYQGKVYLLADASNSSATFFLIQYLKQNKLATVVGQTSGGNRQGITGGQIFMLTLPNSGVEIDVPVIGYYPPTPQPDKGIEPDVPVTMTVADLVEGKDASMQKALELIATQ